MQNINVKIEGMTCQNCVRHVTEALEEISGVAMVNVSLEEKQAIIEAESSVGEEIINAAIDEAGYKVTGFSAQ